ncbi:MULTISPECIES: phospho-N-acetylmuramoyl-pentapeptide-transferase [unclassified Exiguobacterium]|uniref:phospho-N-acetylmuramoyl-pentapeptide- transferase n=1 Tax=unclassified Exiguobacterium TaxID=2644629 RepID=UPI00103E9B69|nr:MULTISPECIES: phospho-N-acetylmuramoyl-pentapeptide-transferase [unclassified Exiguobacterium]TCI45558.1 phospho-N-acetylmuramoyl-pentapeptide-transferase [Exiguobacterium sp. SH5S32]TCI52761.1 phospho-N-acetylmuramoyl-pentapeptide-transferase [Exiguobacterium sp. SH1S4]TCI70950.1 phospho-N-acetylmuramoyl-pentapeptide-transferase [Exiguobacterium sp. SH1S1]
MLISLIVLISSLLTVLVVMPRAIPALRNLKFGQEIRDEGPDWHQKKSGTPTMGGIVILLALLVGFFVSFVFGEAVAGFGTLLFVTLAFGIIGFLDDYIKVVNKRNLGLTSLQKLIGQIIVSVLFVWFLSLGGGLDTTISIPFTSIAFDTGWFYIAIVIFWLVGFSNAVNLTDGLDGLVSFSAIPTFAFFGIYALGQDEVGIAWFAFSTVGALLGFLVFNKYPAKIFMGDTGSLALGGAVAGLALMLKLELLLVFVGIIFVIETLSVILQVISFKTTGKRIFKMSPIHHHFEMVGWSEWRIVLTFSGISLITAVLSLLLM